MKWNIQFKSSTERKYREWRYLISWLRCSYLLLRKFPFLFPCSVWYNRSLSFLQNRKWNQTEFWTVADFQVVSPIHKGMQCSPFQAVTDNFCHLKYFLSPSKIARKPWKFNRQKNLSTGLQMYFTCHTQNKARLSEWTVSFDGIVRRPYSHVLSSWI